MGEFTREVLCLDRQSLRTLRRRRRELRTHVLLGTRGLRGLPLDRLPAEVRARVEARRRALERQVRELDDLIRDTARAELIERDPEGPARARARRAYLDGLGAVIPPNPTNR